jgi:hypothetical protein
MFNGVRMRRGTILGVYGVPDGGEVLLTTPDTTSFVVRIVTDCCGTFPIWCRTHATPADVLRTSWCPHCMEDFELVHDRRNRVLSRRQHLSLQGVAFNDVLALSPPTASVLVKVGPEVTVRVTLEPTHTLADLRRLVDAALAVDGSGEPDPHRHFTFEGVKERTTQLMALPVSGRLLSCGLLAAPWLEARSWQGAMQVRGCRGGGRGRGA